MAATDVVWVGIDAGKTSHHAAAIDATGKRLWSVKVGNGERQIEELIDRAAKTSGEVRWAVDLVSPPAALLLALLLTRGEKVVYVPGRVVHGMAGVFRGEGKTDAKDARIIADTARMRSDLTELTATDELVVELTRLTSYRADVMADWVRGVNRLRALLTSVFPALEAAFDYSTRSALILLTGFCTPAEIRRAGPGGVADYLREQGAWAKGIDKMADTAVQAAQEQTVALPGETTTALLVKRLARQLLDVDREIKDTDRLLTSRFRDHPQAHIIESLPGMGPILGAQFLVATDGRPLEAFASSGRLASYAGLVPVPRDSGRVTGNNHRPKRYHRPLRNVFYMMALSSLRTNGPSKVFYQRKRDENKIHTQALLALARRMVDVLWALLRDNRTFSPIPPSQVSAIAA
ncbi:IS110 family transposase [Actinomadura geliboluensis]|jgi:transposase|uniref:IS110 family transposase n=1 Tax=Actinomadura geliboluensis TaxID=882440 RepID=A0A5S4G8N4_9ACTN|nr:IS110 family transposase [Actinomadura geliboluensis]TMR22330.1 IS110 family transposase [Actinomadura geliboluensis]